MTFWKKKEQFKDERIEKESNKFTAVFAIIFLVEIILMLAVKLFMQEPVVNYALELGIITVFVLYVGIRKIRLVMPGVGSMDDALKEIHNEILAKAFNYMFMIMIFGELVYMIYFFSTWNIGEQHYEEWPVEMTWLILYMASWFIPALIITVVTIKRGWMIWGSKKREKVGTKEFAKRTAIGALFYGVFMTLPDLFAEGVFHPEGLWKTLAMTLGWGIPFFLIMLGLMKISEKRANKAMDKEVEEDEE